MLLGIIGWLVTSITGAIYLFTTMNYVTLDVKVLTLSGFIILPLKVLCTLVFYGIWKTNQFYLYTEEYKLVLK